MNVDVLATIERVSRGRVLDFVLVFAVCNSYGHDTVSKNDIIKDLRGIPFPAPTIGSKIRYEWLTRPLNICGWSEPKCWLKSKEESCNDLVLGSLQMIGGYKSCKIHCCAS